MRLLPHFILLLLILIGLTVGRAAQLDDGGSSQVHPEFKSMLVGGDRAVHDGSISVYGWLLAALLLLLFLSLLLLGCYKSKLPAGLLVSCAVGLLVCVGAFARMWLTYQEYGRQHINGFATHSTDAAESETATTNDDSIPLLGPFPPPTSWMFFGVAFAPLIFMFAYLFGFERWLGSPPPLQGSKK